MSKYDDYTRSIGHINSRPTSPRPGPTTYYEYSETKMIPPTKPVKKKKSGKKLVCRRPLPKFILDDAMLTELNPDSKYVIVFHADPGDMSPEILNAMKNQWAKSMGAVPAVVFAMTKDIEMDIYEVKP